MHGRSRMTIEGGIPRLVRTVSVRTDAAVVRIVLYVFVSFHRDGSFL